MTNEQKIKAYLAAGHYVKVGENVMTLIHDNWERLISSDGSKFYYSEFEYYTIEVIQRIPTAYKAWDKVLVLSDISLSCDDSEGGTDAAEYIDEMVWKVWIIKANNGFHYSVYNYDKSDYWYFPACCLAPAFDDDSLSGKEAKVVIDGKEYSVTLKLI